MATIIDVAKVAGVSRSTVSRVLNDQPGVSPDTRDRVLDAISDLNYRPNFAARALKRRKADTVGIIVPSSFRRPHPHEPRGYYFTEIIRGAHNQCTEQGYVLTLLDDESTPDFYKRLLQERRVDGIILIDVELESNLVQDFYDADFSFVVIGTAPDERVACVDVDNYGSAQRVVQYLADLGHNRIAFINGPPTRLASRDRRAGFETMMQRLGLPLPNAYNQQGDFSEDAGREAMQRLLSVSPQPSAVFAANDRMALGAIRATQAAGLLIPEQISIIGFDDIPVASFFQPPLTTMRQPLYKLGSEAARLLLEMLADAEEDMTTRVVLPTTLVERATTGPALHVV